MNIIGRKINLFKQNLIAIKWENLEDLLNLNWATTLKCGNENVPHNSVLPSKVETKTPLNKNKLRDTRHDPREKKSIIIVNYRQFELTHLKEKLGHFVDQKT